MALEELKTVSSDVVAIKADVSEKSERERLLKETLLHFNRIDVLVNNAAVATRYSFLKTTEEEFDRVYNCNLKAPIFLTKIVAEQMIQQGDGGSIINISSVAGHIPMGINYGGSKAALLMNLSTNYFSQSFRPKRASFSFFSSPILLEYWLRRRLKNLPSWDENPKQTNLWIGSLIRGLLSCEIY